MLEPLGIDNNIPGFWLKNGEVAKDLYRDGEINMVNHGFPPIV
jgi:hypothetical protein